MAHYDHDSRYHNSRRHDPYYSGSRDTDRYPRHASPTIYPSSRSSRRLTMSHSVNQNGYTSSYDHRYAAQPPQPPQHASYSYSTNSAYRTDPRTYSRHKSWPPSPSAEDEDVALTKEVPVPVSDVDQVNTGEAKSRGTVDQYPIIEEIEQPKPLRPDLTDDRRFVLVSDPTAHRKDADHTSTSASSARQHRRKSFAERGNMPHLKTQVQDPPVFTERTPTPYAYNKPQKESITPQSSVFLSPEPITPSTTNIPRSVPTPRDSWESHRDQNARPSKPVRPPTPTSASVHGRFDSFTQSPRVPKNDVFEDSDSGEDTTHLRTERKPARYSFVKSDLQKEDLRTSLLDSQAKADAKRSEQPPSANGYSKNGYSSSKTSTPRSESPRSSTSSFKEDSQRPKARPAPVETGHAKTSRTYSDSRASRPASPFRPKSPVQREVPPSPPRSPQLPPRRFYESPTSSRPSSRSGPVRPPSPLSSSATMPVPPRVPITEADWHATYPPNPTDDRSRPPSRGTRFNTIPIPAPQINVKSPSPARPSNAPNPLPYPVDDRVSDAFMPPEQAYQYDHSTTAPPAPPPRQPYPESFPRAPQSPMPSSPRERPSDSFPRPQVPIRQSTAPDDLPRMRRSRSSSLRSQSSQDGQRNERKTLSLNKPLPSCPRKDPSSEYDDWYTLDGCPNFDICPTCYISVFADTPFNDYFKPVRRYDSRFCDFASPWMRLAWLLTIKQQRKGLDLLYTLATIDDMNRPCPNDRLINGGEWYGIPDQRDGVHVANFAICPCDLKMTETLFPSIRGYMTRLPSTNQMERPRRCSLRIESKRFPKYLDLLLEIDEAARAKGRAPDIQRFINMARDHAIKEECTRGTLSVRKPWHFIPSLPEFTVCEECYDEVVWPEIQKKNSIARLFNRNLQFVPGEDSTGSGCCLYSERMRRIWDRAVEDRDYNYLERKAVDRKKTEVRTERKKADLNRWMQTMANAGGYRDSEFERLKGDLKRVEEEWKRTE